MIKNTLFRFISMRAPEHLEKKEVDLRFVRHPDLLNTNNHFLTAISAATDKTRRQVINTSATDFSGDSWQTREEVKSKVGENFYKFAIWLSSNRTTFTLEELNEMTPPAPAISDALHLQLWDNLFYQIVTFKSGYVREAILSVLVASHFLKNKANVEGLKELRKLAQARVIIPQESFGTVKVPSRELALQKKLNDLPISTRHLDLSAKRGIALSRITELEKVAKELKVAKKVYDKENALAFRGAKKVHNDAVKDAYTNATPEIQTYIDKDTGLTRKIKSYPDLILPEFSFDPKEELHDDYIKNRMSYDSYKFIAELKDNGFISTYEEAFEIIDQNIEEETATAYSYVSYSMPSPVLPMNPGFQAPVLAPNNEIDNPGDHDTQPGMITPQIGSPITNPTVFNINSSGISSGASSLLMVIGGMPVTGIEVIGADYTVTLENGNIVTRHNDFTYDWVGDKLHATIFKDNKISTTGSETITLEGTLKLRNGATITFSGDCHTENDTSNIGIAQQRKVYKGNGKFTYKSMTVTDDHGDDIPPRGSVIDYKPSGFGVKRLGIADYRKVEQEVCCYVPGEVSNIENVMAREYKEKSTRRLRRSEDTTTTSKEQEKEKLTDTTTTDRFEMNREVSNLLAEDTSIGVNTSYRGPTGAGEFTVGADFAHNTTKEHSDNQAVTQAKEVTERALERVVQKVKEERIIKIIEEYEETNKHGYDNREGNQHISGVYRWVDKIYNNKIVNYGKRLMYEFMIPEPAAFHAFAHNDKLDLPMEPIDPRIGDGLVAIETHSKITSLNYQIWAAMYNAEVTPCPDKNKYIGKSFENAGGGEEFPKESADIDIPEGYFTKSFSTAHTFSQDGNNGYSWSLNIGNFHTDRSDTEILSGNLDPYYNKIHVGYSSVNHKLSSITISIKTELSVEAEEKWRMETFNAIISAYELRKAEYDEKVKELKASITQKVATNPLFYRQIENISLKKNCIAYLADHDNMGLDMLTGRDSEDVNADYKDARLEKYAAFVKFFEQAFEWDLMSYNFYPFYWAAKKDKWKDLYNIDNDDPLFRSFLQSGMARVVLTVRPGFEETVNWYMGTGQIWNGGQVPTLDDPLFISIVEELKEPEGQVEETWESRVPTSLTVLQSGTIGLDAEGLPCNPECDEFKVLDKKGKVIKTLTNDIKPKKFQIGRAYDANGIEIPKTTGEPPLEGDDPLPSV